MNATKELNPDILHHRATKIYEEARFDLSLLRDTTRRFIIFQSMYLRRLQSVKGAECQSKSLKELRVYSLRLQYLYRKRIAENKSDAVITAEIREQNQLLLSIYAVTLVTKLIELFAPFNAAVRDAAEYAAKIGNGYLLAKDVAVLAKDTRDTVLAQKKATVKGEVAKKGADEILFGKAAGLGIKAKAFQSRNTGRNPTPNSLLHEAKGNVVTAIASGASDVKKLFDLIASAVKNGKQTKLIEWSIQFSEAIMALGKNVAELVSAISELRKLPEFKDKWSTYAKPFATLETFSKVVDDAIKIHSEFKNLCHLNEVGQAQSRLAVELRVGTYGKLGKFAKDPSTLGGEKYRIPIVRNGRPTKSNVDQLKKMRAFSVIVGPSQITSLGSAEALTAKIDRMLKINKSYDSSTYQTSEGETIRNRKRIVQRSASMAEYILKLSSYRDSIRSSNHRTRNLAKLEKRITMLLKEMELTLISARMLLKVCR